MTTFGELTSIAEEHLGAVAHANIRGYTDAQSVALLSEVARCLRSCRLLWRTVDLVDRRFCDPDQAWQRAGITLDHALTETGRLLARRTGTSLRGDQRPEAFRLHAAAVAIGASHDLLATHTRESRRGVVDLTGFGAVIDSADGRRALATMTAQHVGHLVAIAEQVGRNEGARRATRETALRVGDTLKGALHAIRSADILQLTVPDLLSPVPVVPPLRLAPVRDGESPSMLLHEAVNGAQRLHRIAREELGDGQFVRHTAGTMANIAVAMSTAHLVSAQVLQQLVPQVTVLVVGPRGAELATGLDAASLAADGAGRAWAAVRARWRGLRTPAEHGPPDVIRHETADLVTRVGRLGHTDPAWRPRLDADPQLRGGAQLAGDLPELVRLLDGLRQLNAAIVDIAADQIELTHALSAHHLLLVRTRTLPFEYDAPRPWTTAPSRTVQKLGAAQHHASSSSRQSWAAAVSLSGFVPSHHRTADTRLDARRLEVTADVGRTLGASDRIPGAPARANRGGTDSRIP